MIEENKKFALVGPNFFSYIQAIQRKFSEKGYITTFFDERHANSIIIKILYRIGYFSIFSRRKNRHLDKIVAQIIQSQLTDVILIDVEVCDTRFVKQLVDAGVKVHLYMWDSAKNKPNYLRYLHLLQGKSSFDYVDCVRHDLTYIPLFAEDVFSAKQQNTSLTIDKVIDISFCGTLHSNRPKKLTELVHLAKNKSIKLSLMLFFHSRLLVALKSFKQIDNARFIRKISVTGFSKQRIFNLFTQSKYVLDLPHPGQVGLTARTFEVLRSGAKLITFNKMAGILLPPSLLDRILIIEDIEEIDNIDFFAGCSTASLSDADDYFLSLERFLDQLLDLTRGRETN